LVKDIGRRRRARAFARSLAQVRRALPATTQAIYIQLIGNTGDDYRRRSEYLVKAVHPKARLPIQRKRNSQGRIYAKRCGTSEDIGLAARIRADEAARGLISPNTGEPYSGVLT
jgi:hypothetical protein